MQQLRAKLAGAMTSWAIFRENKLRLKREMDGLRDELFARPEDERMVADEAHIPTEDGAPVETDAKRAWKDRQRQLRQVQ